MATQKAISIFENPTYNERRLNNRQPFIRNLMASKIFVLELGSQMVVRPVPR